MMNERIKKQIKVSNPFLFKHISNLKSIGHFDDVGPCVMMASPGMLVSRLSFYISFLAIWSISRIVGALGTR
jgi:cleavage and polyadenylation specificity factor subunit 3